MALKFKKGDRVSQIVPVIEGEVVNSAIVDDEVSFLVAYEDLDGVVHERWFKDSELEVA